MWPTKKIIPIALASVVSIGAIVFAVVQQNAPEPVAVNTDAEPTVTSSDLPYSTSTAWQSALGIISTSSPTGVFSVPSTTPSTMTEKFSQDLADRYVAMAGSGKQPTEQDIVKMESDLLSQLKNASIPHYKIGAIKTFPDSNTDAVRGYSNSFVALLSKYSSAFSFNPFQVLNQIAESGDRTALKTFDTEGASFMALADDLSKIYVPSALADNHLLAINTYYRMGEVIIGLKSGLDDPIKAVAYNNEYLSDVNALKNIYKYVQTYLVNGNITFAPNEIGSYWYKIY